MSLLLMNALGGDGKVNKILKTISSKGKVYERFHKRRFGCVCGS